MDGEIMDGEIYELQEPMMETLEPVPTPQPEAEMRGTTSVLRNGPRPYYSRDPNSRLVRRPQR